jgi:hypothetical protein
LLAPFRGQQARKRAPCSAVRLVRVTGQTGVAGKIRRETNESRPGRISSGRRTPGCPRHGRPARTSLDIAEMKEEQHGRGWKSKGTRKKR